ncbi:MAG: hypothetical protein UX08_C0020G0010 [Candidatus Collierbacteria bacterium GW2011_GWB1_45_35]|uniref:Uncharacterized protein n=2 Tax=Candidatus Collieribacteriota TaxID=1752725 RepID=A0A0G1KPE9_9BACT|nr:MAG: hypothetical protein UW48_C0013G0012 [Microgenomates group bacterium GW2011_GWC1_44_23]KKT85360.1 MAG: hypothetical protein UW84_C0034G0004 [Candidatus Collierbacteria bacterium GW2011_GWA2_44_99]KKT94995.1 MAG: hypothetical protein UW96_C0012G0012 [Candidatus Collierbacteria bacterium GW2011_GWA1_45_15]KKT99020.1 MAG: hypothetical protein UX01_C0014G0010 [Candidatus Collierbacteria bacterium GW2011_GWB2_45_17]KKU04634.1 MAG: hypothetical protein UX08_C0020G0010 [Candidatus Collierbacte
MGNMQERLKGVYIKPKGEVGSWISKKTASNPFDELKKTLKPDGSLSPRRTEDLLVEQENLIQAKIIIFESVAHHMLAEGGEKYLEVHLKNFHDSWDKLFIRYGTMMVLALKELANDMNFLRPDGEIKKAVLGRKIREMKKRFKDQ